MHGIPADIAASLCYAALAVFLAAMIWAGLVAVVLESAETPEPQPPDTEAPCHDS